MYSPPHPAHKAKSVLIHARSAGMLGGTGRGVGTVQAELGSLARPAPSANKETS